MIRLTLLLPLLAGCTANPYYPSAYSPYGTGYPYPVPDRNGQYPCWAFPPGTPERVSCDARQASAGMPDIPLQPGNNNPAVPPAPPSFSAPAVPGFSFGPSGPSPLPSPPAGANCRSTETTTDLGPGASETTTSGSCRG